MPALNNSSAAEKDPDHMDVVEEDDNEGGDEGVEDDVKALEEVPKERSPSEEQSELEFIEGVDLEDIRKYVECPICLGIIKKTRTVMGCLHRFCQECINKSMRRGNHNCPTCRKHYPSRRSLRPDPLFDAFIAATFGNIDSYEDQDVAFDEDELARKKQIQASIAQVSQRQSEALKDAVVLPGSQPSGNGSRRGRRSRNMVHDTSQAAHDDDGDNNRGRASSSSSSLAEPSAPRRRKRRSATRSTAQPSSSSACPNNNDNNVTEEEAHRRDSRAILDGIAWGRCATRSNPSQGASIKSIRNARLDMLVEYLASIGE